MERRRTRFLPALLGIVMTAGLVAGASVSWGQESGGCVTSSVPEAFTLPDGRIHAAGRVTFCAVLALNPVTGLHEMRLEGEGSSLVMSHRARAEATKDSRPVLLFRRVDEATLALVGFVLPDGRRSWSYTLRRIGPKGAADPQTAVAVRPAREL